jgi:hypothetical protein
LACLKHQVTWLDVNEKKIALLRKGGRVVTNFVMQALSGQPLRIYVDGSQTLLQALGLQYQYP